MRYNVYGKNKSNEYIFVYIKRKVSDSYKYDWTGLECLNAGYCDEDYTKVSLNIFEAKKGYS